MERQKGLVLGSSSAPLLVCCNACTKGTGWVLGTARRSTCIQGHIFVSFGW
uniref:Uncharacterized protein n=1 Tax=Arundo donax TaxID=35708 RepID=A0A0A9HH76_ARUDO